MKKIIKDMDEEERAEWLSDNDLNSIAYELFDYIK